LTSARQPGSTGTSDRRSRSARLGESPGGRLSSRPSPADILIIGAGAAGLATAIFTQRFSGGRSLILLEAARRPGAKILVSGGGRCNVTNARVAETDFWGGRRSFVRRVLRAFPPERAIAFFADLGVPLHEEADGKMFPDTQRSRDVLAALLASASGPRLTLLADRRVEDVRTTSNGFQVITSGGVIDAATVVLAAGGQSLPKSGSDGSGFELARRLGHAVVPPTPGLVPLVLDDNDAAMHRELAGVAHDVELTIRVNTGRRERITGSMLWTHFGISGPAALNASRHWLRAALEGHEASLTASFCPGETFERVDRAWTALASTRPRASVHGALAQSVPASVASALLRRLDLAPSTPLAHFTRADRHRLVQALTEWPLHVVRSRGYTYAEVTAGGVSLDEIDASTMASRVCPGLFLVGEVLDVDGRIGGFNFQWAWSSAYVAAAALAGRHQETAMPVEADA
jgi:predicted Rossmann fold flavoprotein